MPIPSMKHLYLLSAFVLAASSVSAGGFSRAETSQKALGLGGAYSAIGRDASVAYFNPAILARLDTNMVSLGLSMMSPRSIFQHAQTAEESLTQQVWLPLGYLYGTYQISDKFAAGLSVNTPYAYNTRWEDNWQGASIARHASFYSLYVQPTLSYRITDNFSVGAGLVLATGRMEFARRIGETEVAYSAQASGTGIGYNLGVHGNLDEFVSFGITYRSAVKMDLKNGEATFENRGAFESVLPGSAAFRSRADLPSTLSVGLADRISDKVQMVFEFNLTGWSVYDSIRFEYPDGELPNSRRARLYEDAMAFRAGLQYKHDSLTTFRIGGFYDETPVKDNYLSAELPNANALGFAVGASRKITERFEVDFAYSFQGQRARVIDSSPASFLNPTQSGIYKTFIHSAGVGFNYSF